MSRRTLITGASSGIGRALALALATDAPELHLVARGSARLETCAREARGRGARVCVHEADLSQDEEVERLVRTLSAELDRLDVLIHSAGAVALGRVSDAPVEDLDRQYRLNLRLPYLLTQKLLALLESARGQIVFVNSGAGLHARPGWSQYAMTKHGLKALADSLRDEVVPRGVRVVSVYPGRTATPMQEEVHRLEGRSYEPERFLRPEDVAAQIMTALSLPESASVVDLSIRPTRG